MAGRVEVTRGSRIRALQRCMTRLYSERLVSSSTIRVWVLSESSIVEAWCWASNRLWMNSEGRGRCAGGRIVGEEP
jgi:hypothetical protein